MADILMGRENFSQYLYSLYITTVSEHWYRAKIRRDLFLLSLSQSNNNVNVTYVSFLDADFYF